jgi:hypothetical protein
MNGPDGAACSSWRVSGPSPFEARAKRREHLRVTELKLRCRRQKKKTVGGRNVLSVRSLFTEYANERGAAVKAAQDV